MKSSLNAWLKLVRLPNLVTVPGDPLAGFFIAWALVAHDKSISVVMVLPCMASSLLLYMSGLILNDYVDYIEDKEYRPDRPIPSGKVSRSSALIVGFLLGVAGIAVAGIPGKSTMLVAVCLAILILLYNSVARKVQPLGRLTMGLCRGCSLLLGASVIGVSSTPVTLAVVGVTFYIMEVSNIAYGEVHGKLALGVRWFPAIALLLMYITFHYRLGRIVPLSIALSVLAVMWALERAYVLGKPEADGVISHQVGLLLRGLLLIQASFCTVAGRPGLFAAACLLLMWPISMLLSRKYYAS